MAVVIEHRSTEVSGAGCSSSAHAVKQGLEDGERPIYRSAHRRAAGSAQSVPAIALVRYRVSLPCCCYFPAKLSWPSFSESANDQSSSRRLSTRPPAFFAGPTRWFVHQRPDPYLGQPCTRTPIFHKRTRSKNCFQFTHPSATMRTMATTNPRKRPMRGSASSGR